MVLILLYVCSESFMFCSLVKTLSENQVHWEISAWWFKVIWNSKKCERSGRSRCIL